MSEKDFLKELDSIKPKYKLGQEVYWLMGYEIKKVKITSVDVRIVEERNGDKSIEYLKVKYLINFDRFVSENELFLNPKDLKDNLIIKEN